MFQPSATSFLAVSKASPNAAGMGRFKRLLDITTSAALLVFFLPLLALIAVLIVVTTGGPIFFKQHRGGAGGRSFEILKFRTLYSAECDHNIRQVERADPRVTAVGKFLRKTSLDELPQLVNVLCGDMSLVGPRPHALQHDYQFQTLVPEYYKRFAVRPGITGLAQVRGFRGPIRNIDDISGRTDSDVEYVENWNLWMDIKILLLTLKVPVDSRAF